jgi:hypothetical protein
MIPDFSPPYWILSQLYYLNEKTEAAEEWSQKAFLINPLFNDPSLIKLIREYKSTIRHNKLFKSLPDFLKAFKNRMPYEAYNLFDKLNKPATLKLNLHENFSKYIDAYYLTPLMVRSIFDNSLHYLLSQKEHEIALDLIKKLKTIKPEYNFRRIFEEYEIEIKSQLASDPA